MAVSLNFRTAIGGFHKEDVVRYIEYVNTKHTGQVNQLQGEMEELRGKIAELSAKPDLTGEVAALKAQLEQAELRFTQKEQEKEQLAIAHDEAVALLQQQIAELTAQRDAALAQIEEVKAQQADAAARELAAMELEAYRRAEQAERSAKLRAEQIYQQATGTLAQATTQVDSAAMQYKQIAEAVGTQLVQLQQALDGSKNALLDAATTMYSIRPEEIRE